MLCLCSYNIDPQGLISKSVPVAFRVQFWSEIRVGVYEGWKEAAV